MQKQSRPQWKFAELTAFAKKLDGIERLQKNGMVHITRKIKTRIV
jgi:hypothetical protein